MRREKGFEQVSHHHTAFALADPPLSNESEGGISLVYDKRDRHRMGLNYDKNVTDAAKLSLGSVRSLITGYPLPSEGENIGPGRSRMIEGNADAAVHSRC